MKILRNTGSERVIDLLRPLLTAEAQLDVVSFFVLSLRVLRDARAALERREGASGPPRGRRRPRPPWGHDRPRSTKPT